MANTYIEYVFKVTPLQPTTEILVAELANTGFESFVENEEGVSAYIRQQDWSPDILKEIYVLSSSEFDIRYTYKMIEQVNWNAEWEKNFSPIVVNDLCAVRAPFHEPFDVRYEIVIEPKMSFGTGHHETTFMMLSYILENNFEGKTVLDMGCGTSVLAILCEMRGATAVDAIDIDDWCVENSEENIARNRCSGIRVQQGDAAVLPSEETYDTVIANINRNILLADMNTYISALKKGGGLYLSGFYEEDLAQIEQACKRLGLNLVSSKERNGWIAAKFVN